MSSNREKIFRSVICISFRKNSDQLIVGEEYMIDVLSTTSDADGDWYVDVYDGDVRLGRNLLSHFKDV